MDRQLTFKFDESMRDIKIVVDDKDVLNLVDKIGYCITVPLRKSSLHMLSDCEQEILF